MTLPRMRSKTNLEQIVRVYIRKFQRLGDHPYKHLLHKKKHPICTWFFGSGNMYDGVLQTAGVVVELSSGKRIEYECNSYAQAIRVEAEILKMIEET